MDVSLYRDYLRSFLEEFEYEKSDSDFLCDAYERIVSNDGARTIFSVAIEVYGADEHCDYEALLKQSEKAAIMIGRHSYTTDLLMFILFSRRLAERYAERGYPREVWHNTMLDLKYKLIECKLIKGTVGSFVAGWFPGFFRVEMFALGRLQFELIPFRGNYKGLDGNVKVIGMHIPRDGTPLDPERCNEAFMMAKEWYKGKATVLDGKNVFYCGSWLLYPGAIPSMPETSNVRRFFERFEIYDVKENFSSYDMWRLFDTDERNPDKLPADSSLRRLYIARMREGLPFGEGRGFFYL